MQNCSGQYKCRQYFYNVASFLVRVAGVSVTHKFSQKFHFKGVWDAAGKVTKSKMGKLELRDVQMPTALECFKTLWSPLVSNFKMKKDWKKYEEELDKRILDKGKFTVTARHVGFATDSKDEYKKLGNEYGHIIFTDRSNVPTMKKLVGTQKLHEVQGESNRVDPLGNNGTLWHPSCRVPVLHIAERCMRPVFIGTPEDKK